MVWLVGVYYVLLALLYKTWPKLFLEGDACFAVGIYSNEAEISLLLAQED